MPRELRTAERVAGVVWFLSWFELYLEIVRHRHVPVPGLVGLDAGISGHAGGWIRTVLACAALAPAVFVARYLWRRARGVPLSAATAPPPPFPVSKAMVGFGLFLCAAGAINQAIRRPPMVVDLTLRTGNGGFVVLGVVLTAAGLALWLVRTGPTRRVGR